MFNQWSIKGNKKKRLSIMLVMFESLFLSLFLSLITNWNRKNWLFPPNDTNDIPVVIWRSVKLTTMIVHRFIIIIGFHRWFFIAIVSGYFFHFILPKTKFRMNLPLWFCCQKFSFYHHQNKKKWSMDRCVTLICLPA